MDHDESVPVIQPGASPARGAVGLPGHFPGCPRYDHGDPFASDWCDCAQARAEGEVPPVALDEPQVVSASFTRDIFGPGDAESGHAVGEVASPDEPTREELIEALMQCVTTFTERAEGNVRSHWIDVSWWESWMTLLRRANAAADGAREQAATL